MVRQRWQPYCPDCQRDRKVLGMGYLLASGSIVIVPATIGVLLVLLLGALIDIEWHCDCLECERGCEYVSWMRDFVGEG